MNITEGCLLTLHCNKSFFMVFGNHCLDSAVQPGVSAAVLFLKAIPREDGTQVVKGSLRKIKD